MLRATSQLILVDLDHPPTRVVVLAHLYRDSQVKLQGGSETTASTALAISVAEATVLGATRTMFPTSILQGEDLTWLIDYKEADRDL
jgi:hypothetical protein